MLCSGYHMCHGSFSLKPNLLITRIFTFSALSFPNNHLISIPVVDNQALETQKQPASAHLATLSSEITAFIILQGLYDISMCLL